MTPLKLFELPLGSRFRYVGKPRVYVLLDRADNGLVGDEVNDIQAKVWQGLYSAADSHEEFREMLVEFVPVEAERPAPGEPASIAVPSMNRWEANLTPHESRRLGKTGEELAELLAVILRITIQGLDAIDPSSGKTNRQRFHEETADVVAQMECNFKAFNMPATEIYQRRDLKISWMAQWEAHYAEGAK